MDSELCYNTLRMTFRMYVIFMTLATLLSWGGWGLVIWNTDPTQAGVMGLILFYVTLLMGLIGLLTLFGLIFRTVILRRQEVLMRQVRAAFRHAVLLSFIAITALVLSAGSMLHWWVLGVLILVMCGVEYLFLLGEEARRT